MAQINKPTVRQIQTLSNQAMALIHVGLKECVDAKNTLTIALNMINRGIVRSSVENFARLTNRRQFGYAIQTAIKRGWLPPEIRSDISKYLASHEIKIDWMEAERAYMADKNGDHENASS